MVTKPGGACPGGVCLGVGHIQGALFRGGGQCPDTVDTLEVRWDLY